MREGWGQGVCIGDFDNDGNPDLFETFYGHNVLYRNRGDGTFEDVTEKVGLPVSGTRYGSGCTFTDYDRDGNLDLFVSNYVDLDLNTTPRPGKGEFCVWKDIPVMCGPRGLPLAHNILYHNDGHGKFEDVSEAAGILKPGWPLQPGRGRGGFRQRWLAGYLCSMRYDEQPAVPQSAQRKI